MYEVVSGLYFSAYQTRISLTVRRGQGTTQSKQQEIDYKRQKRNKPRSPALTKDYCSLSHNFCHLDKRSRMFKYCKGSMCTWDPWWTGGGVWWRVYSRLVCMWYAAAHLYCLGPNRHAQISSGWISGSIALGLVAIGG